MKSIICLPFILVLTSIGYAQSTYFNKGYLYNDYTSALAIVENQNKYVFWGVTYDSIDNNESVFLASIDSTGNLLYWNTISNSQNEYWAGYRGSLEKVDKNGYISAGHVNYANRSNAILYRFDLWGDTIWTQQYLDTISEMRTQFWNCNTTSDNGFVGIGYHSIEPYNGDILLVKTDSLGTELWRKEYGLASNNIEMGYSVAQTPDLGYLIGYYHYVSAQDDTGDPVVMKVDSVGNPEWELNLGGPFRDFFTQVCIGNDGNYIAGTSLSDSTSGTSHYSRIKIYKISPEGNILWNKYYCQTELDNKLYAIYPDHDGGYIATGKRRNLTHPGNWNRSYGWLLKVDENGDSVWYREYRYYISSGNTFNDLYDIALSPDKGYVIAGSAWNISDPLRAWIIKVDSMGCDTPGCATGVGIDYFQRPETGDRSLYIFPNPSSDNIYIRHQLSGIKYQISIFDLYGRKQDEIIIPKDQEQIKVDVSGYPAGVYVAVMKDEKGVVARAKFVKSGGR